MADYASLPVWAQDLVRGMGHREAEPGHREPLPKEHAVHRLPMAHPHLPSWMNGVNRQAGQ